MDDPIGRRVFTTPEIAKIIDRTVPKTIAYVTRGLISPSIQDASGYGSRREWSYLDLIRMCLIAHLEDLGLSVATIRRLREAMDDGNMLEGCRWFIQVRRGEEKLNIAERGMKALGGSRDAMAPIEVERGCWLYVLMGGVECERIMAPDNIHRPTMIISMSFLHKWARDKIPEV